MVIGVSCKTHDQFVRLNYLMIEVKRLISTKVNIVVADLLDLGQKFTVLIEISIAVMLHFQVRVGIGEFEVEGVDLLVFEDC